MHYTTLNFLEQYTHLHNPYRLAPRKNRCARVSVLVNRCARSKSGARSLFARGRSVRMRKTNLKERGRFTCCFTKLGMVYLRGFIHQTLKPELCSYCILELLKSHLHCTFKIYHFISTIYILTFDKRQNIYHRY